MQALFLLNHLAVHLDRLGRASADLDQDRRLKVAALYIMLDAIAVFPRRELRKRPFPRIQAIALLLLGRDGTLIIAHDEARPGPS